MSQFSEITIHTTTAASELIADAMWNYTDFGVNICDANDIVNLQKGKDGIFWDYMDDNLKINERADVLVKCYVSLDKTEEVRRLLRKDIHTMVENAGGMMDFGSLEDTVRSVDGDAWLEVWKEHFRPIHLGKIVVVPEWIDYAPTAEERVVLLDSNMAFGTGEHETTSMCVELLQEYLTENSICIDVGCGSGILGISAIKLGAKKADLTDIDPVAVDSANHNAALNGVADNVTVSHSNLLDENKVMGDVIVANITAEVLALLSPSIPKYLAVGGVLILSGIIHDRLDMVKETYAREGLFVERERQKGEWHALVLRRK
ncbi:MAG: 50S ribosomal protein L11 methyltransferase [Clostridia bacterium]|nr:50S ribosomal protein L11 methyltransferase [Clostridia bacterium]